MMKLADIYEMKGGRKKVVFYDLGIYDLLREELRFRYIVIKKRGYYLRYVNGIYIVVPFYVLKDSLLNFIKISFNSLKFNIPIDYQTFINEYNRKSPLKNGNFAREYLREDFELSLENTQLILSKIDQK